MSKKPAPRAIPRFSKDLPHGEVFSSAGMSGGGAATRYIQNGHRFAANGDYIGPEVDAPETAVAEEEELEQQPALALELTDEDVERLLAQPDAAELLKFPLDQLAQLVAARGGPSFSGDNAARLYAAWIIKADEAAGEGLIPDDPDQRRPGGDGTPDVV